MRYTPFDKRIEDLTGPDLGVLREVSEGWYVEYKSAPIVTKAIAKSISAFANHYGGWLFFGISEISGKASAFPGIVDADILELERSIRNASVDCLHPHVFYEHAIIRGPVDELALPAGRGIVVVRVPPGSDTPYIHVDGRIYRRIADASDPKHETDRAILDQLSERGRSARRKLKKLLTDVPIVSKAESNNPYLHIFISSDPFELSSRRFGRDFDWFRKTMCCDPIPFDNFFSNNTGYVARQTSGNCVRNRVFTWEYFFRGHSRVTLPINAYSRDLAEQFATYNHSHRFLRKLESDGLVELELGVLDLNVLFACLCGITVRHRALVSDFNDLGPFYVKAYLENTWRCVPYLDTGAFVSFVEQNGVPVVQDDKQLIPPGGALESFVTIERAQPNIDIESQSRDATGILVWIYSALGIPMDVLKDSASEIGSLLDRSKSAQAHRHGLTPA